MVQPGAYRVEVACDAHVPGITTTVVTPTTSGRQLPATGDGLAARLVLGAALGALAGLARRVLRPG